MLHPAASTLKLPLVMAAHRLAGAGRLDLDEQVRVTSRFTSRPTGPPYELTPDYDNDDEPWQRLGGTAPLRWLMERAIVRSSNLATNLLIDRVGLDAVNEVYDPVGATASRLRRGIQDTRADDPRHRQHRHGCRPGSRRVRAARRPAARSARGRRGGAAAGGQRVERRHPRRSAAGTYVAHKAGWTDDCCHDVAVVRPVDEPPFVLSIFTGTRLARGGGARRRRRGGRARVAAPARATQA